MRLAHALLALPFVLAQSVPPPSPPTDQSALSPLAQHPLRSSDEFGLSIVDHRSTCFEACHLAAVKVVLLPKLGINSGVFVARNCRLPFWGEVVGACLAMVCRSAPDVAYAAEYGQAWCERAGTSNASIVLPEWYLETPGGAYYQNAMASSAARVAFSVSLCALTLALVLVSL
ncbi:hypothetical protein CspeluHIS016_0604060 [Cutaneotrichosporon spelunceum]|uniref:Extracellular membrane protein CFEM domain-containing protein n=1 Tax=Cutaneotrichosporon spelunceum TaxID=1672016 RepID=A0AAD3TY32_9TREE|nr:hypothetical protein CspeluHIS016_0604060 [Cutaneotrichosporon spelunceum]